MQRVAAGHAQRRRVRSPLFVFVRPAAGHLIFSQTGPVAVAEIHQSLIDDRRDVLIGQRQLGRLAGTYQRAGVGCVYAKAAQRLGDQSGLMAPGVV